MPRYKATETQVCMWMVTHLGLGWGYVLFYAPCLALNKRPDKIWMSKMFSHSHPVPVWVTPMPFIHGRFSSFSPEETFAVNGLFYGFLFKIANRIVTLWRHTSVVAADFVWLRTFLVFYLSVFKCLVNYSLCNFSIVLVHIVIFNNKHFKEQYFIRHAFFIYL